MFGRLFPSMNTLFNGLMWDWNSSQQRVELAYGKFFIVCDIYRYRGPFIRFEVELGVSFNRLQLT